MPRPSFEDLDAPMEPINSGDGDPVMIFVDTEFTNIGIDSDLLSIGFVASHCNAELYIEILDAKVEWSSLFVRETVLPLFGRHNPEVLTRDQAGVRINEFFDDLRSGDLGRQIVCVSDSSFDWQHLMDLFPPMGYGTSWARERNIVGRLAQNMLASGRQGQAFYEATEDYFRKHRDEQHHALVDARALKHAYWEAKFS